MTWFGRLAKAAQAAIQGMRFPTFMSRYWRDGLSDERNYARLVGDGSSNSIVSACVLWIARTFPEAPPAMWQGDDSGVRNRMPRHPLVQLLRYPTSSPENPGGFYSGVLLWMATLTSWVLDGNAYWFKVRSAMGRVVQLWYVPHWMLEPIWPTDGSAYLSHYEYRVDGRVIPVAPSEIVHFRHGLDPENTRKGRSPLAAVLREVYTDEEAARFTASILKNLGVPGIVVSPVPNASGPPWRPNDDDVKAIRKRFKEEFSGDRRGDPLVMSGPTKVEQFGFSPTEMTLRDLRNIPEERITAVLGIPAAVVGFGAGLQYTKVGATFAGFRDQAWQSNLIPTQRLMSAEIQTQLLPDFETDLETYEFGFDISKVKVLQEDQGKMAERWARLVSSGIAKRAEARNAFDLVSGPEDDVYLPQPGLQATTTGTSDPSNNGSSTDTSEEVKRLSVRLDEILDQVKSASAIGVKSAGPSGPTVAFHKGAIAVSVDAKQSAQPAPVVTFEPGSIEVNVAPPQLNVEAGAIQANTNFDAGAVAVNVEQPQSTSITLERDPNGRLTGAHSG